MGAGTPGRRAAACRRTPTGRADADPAPEPACLPGRPDCRPGQPGSGGGRPATRGGRRRPFRGAGVAARASLAVGAAIRPPLGLWPSVTAMTADFHTGTGERLQIAPSPQLKIELDTQSSLRRRADTEGKGFELVQGQAAIETRAGLRLALFAGAGCGVAGEGGGG